MACVYSRRTDPRTIFSVLCIRHVPARVLQLQRTVWGLKCRLGAREGLIRVVDATELTDMVCWSTTDLVVNGSLFATVHHVVTNSSSVRCIESIDTLLLLGPVVRESGRPDVLVSGAVLGEDIAGGEGESEEEPDEFDPGEGFEGLDIFAPSDLVGVVGGDRRAGHWDL